MVYEFRCLLAGGVVGGWFCWAGYQASGGMILDYYLSILGGSFSM